MTTPQNFSDVLSAGATRTYQMSAKIATLIIKSNVALQIDLTGQEKFSAGISANETFVIERPNSPDGIGTDRFSVKDEGGAGANLDIWLLLI